MSKGRTLEGIDLLILQWDNKFPVDRWWRVRHKVPFGSPQHKRMSHFHMFLEFREEELVKEAIESRERIELDEVLALDGPKKDQTKVVVKMTQKDIDDDFANLDITKFGPKPAKGDKKDTNLL